MTRFYQTVIYQTARLYILGKISLNMFLYIYKFLISHTQSQLGVIMSGRWNFNYTMPEFKRNIVTLNPYV